jgi:hypothetical protein
METDTEIIVPGHDEEVRGTPFSDRSDQTRKHCSHSLGMRFFRALENQGMTKMDDCEDVFLAECVIEPLLELVSYELERPKDTFVAVHALTLDNEGLGLSLCFDSMLVIRDNGCLS